MASVAPGEWIVAPKLITVSARRTLASVLERIARDRPDWVVIVRTHPRTGRIYHYAWRALELTDLASHLTGTELDLEHALGLQEKTSTAVARGRRIQGEPPQASSGAVAARVIDFDAAGRVVAIAEAGVQTPVDRVGGGGRRRGGLRARKPLDFVDSGPPVMTPAAPAQAETTLSAEGPAEVQVGQQQLISFRIELTAEAAPLAHHARARTKADRPIVAVLSVQSPSLSVIGAHVQVLAPPAAGQPRVGFFQIKGEKPGVVRVAVTFRQGGSDLASIGLAIDVVDAQASSAKVAAVGELSTPDPRDDELLELLIEQRVVDGALRYEYRLHGEALGFNYLTLQSKPLLDRGGGPAATLLDYVEGIYERTTKELKSAEDLKALQRELRALGVGLSNELFDPEVARKLWPLRSRIALVRITSWEPYIPWELLRLRDPDTRDVDERFLAEYGLIRTLAGAAPPRRLPLKDWCWLAADFPLRTHTSAGDMSWFTDTLPAEHNVRPKQILPRTDALLDTLAAGDFDVLHLACHAESPQRRIDRAALIIGDKATGASGDPELIQVDTSAVDTEAKLALRRPLVFLNACESGRIAPNLTAWGGWPEVFLRAGAGAFVGTSWAVRDKPAATFARTFYRSMMDGKPLHEAAAAARKAAQAAGDASWLAFKVYGHPRAARA